MIIDTIAIRRKLNERITKMILKMIIDTIADLTGVDKSALTPDVVLVDIGVDELTIVQLFIAIETEFDIEIPDSEELKVGTIQDAVALVERCLGDIAE